MFATRPRFVLPGTYPEPAGAPSYRRYIGTWVARSYGTDLPIRSCSPHITPLSDR